MGKPDAKVKVEISAIDETGAVIKRVQEHFAELGAEVEGLGTLMSTLGVGLAAGGLVGVVAAIGELAHSTAESEMQLGKFHESTGMSIEALAALRLVAKETNGDFESLSSSLVRLGKNIAEGLHDPASKAGKMLKQLFKEDLGSLKLKSVDEQFEAVIKKVFALEKGTDKGLAAATMFGKGWASNVEILKRVADKGIDPLMKAQLALEGHIGPDAVEKAKAYEKSWADLGARWAGVTRQVGEGLIPVLTDLADLINKKGVSTANDPELGEIAMLTAKRAKLQEEVDAHIARMGGDTPSKVIDAYKAEIAAIDTFIAKQNQAFNDPKDLSSIARAAAKAKAEALAAAARLDDKPEKPGKEKKLSESMTEAHRYLKDVSNEFPGGIPGIMFPDFPMAGNRLLEFTAPLKPMVKFLIDEIPQANVNLVGLNTGLTETQKLLVGMSPHDSPLSKLKVDAAELGPVMANSFTQIIETGHGFYAMLQSLIDKIIEMILQQTVFNELAGLAGRGGIGGAIGSVFSGLTGHAAGGDVSAGVPGIVGENGPELFVPASSGSIVPNGKMGGVTNFYYSVDARGADAMADKRLLLAMQMTRQAAVNQAVNMAREGRLRSA